MNGFRYRGIDSNIYGLAVKSINNPSKSEKNTTTQEVIGRDGPYVFEGKHKEKEIELQCTLFDKPNLSQRRYIARDIAAWLDVPGELVFNYEPDKKYDARVPGQIDTEIIVSNDVFSIIFVVQPIVESVFENENLTWEDATIPWNQLDMPWTGYQQVFTGVISGQELTVMNLGTHEALPVIKLSGTASSITLTDDKGNSFTYTGLSGTDIYIDCKNRLVYSLSGSTKVNQRSNFSGKYLSLNSGSNTIDVSGTITSLNIDFDYRNAYL